MKNFFIAVAGTLFLSVFVSGFKSFDGKWEKLGTRTVDMALDHDEILVTALEGRFTKLKIVVTKAPLHIVNCKVVFGNGEEMNLDIKHNFTKNSGTRILDLPGNKRIIKKIKFNYRSVPSAKGKAIVTVFGQH